MIESLEPGYLVFFTSSENDGDDYETVLQTGWTMDDLDLVVALKRELAKFENNCTEYPPEDFYAACVRAAEVITHPDAYSPVEGEGSFTTDFFSCFNDEWGIEDRAEALHELLEKRVYSRAVCEMYWDYTFFLRHLKSIQYVKLESGMNFPAQIEELER